MLLEEDFRTSHDHGELLAEIGSILRDPRRDANAARDPLVEMLASLDHVSSFEDLAVALRGTRDQTAVLCRTNAECLRVSQLLFEQGVDHRLQHEATERVLPAWLAELFRGVDRKRWSESRLESLVATRRAEGVELPETDVVIRFLTDAVGDDTVDLDVFRERALRGVLPDHLHDVEDVPVVVSTVHRAKGLEFDRVFFGAPRNGVPEDEVDELRVLYVALSRSRDDVWSFKAPNMALWHKADETRRAVGQVELERAVEDTWVGGSAARRRHDSASGWRDREGRCRSGATAGLRTLCRAARAVELRLVHVRESEEPIPFYSVLVDGEVFGETSEHFGEMLRRRLRGRGEVRFPRLLTNTFVSGIQTVVGSPGEGEAEGLGVSGMWLGPRIAGLSSVDWYARMSRLDPYYAFRAEMLERLARDLVGPGDVEETISDFPLEQYICGILYPRSEDRYRPGTGRRRRGRGGRGNVRRSAGRAREREVSVVGRDDVRRGSCEGEGDHGHRFRRAVRPRGERGGQAMDAPPAGDRAGAPACRRTDAGPQDLARRRLGAVRSDPTAPTRQAPSP